MPALSLIADILGLEKNITEYMMTTPSSDLDDTDVQDGGILSDHIRYIIEVTIWHIVLPLNIMGVVTNIINIRVFIEQGVRSDSTNIGFVCLSVCDLICCATLIPYSCCFFVQSADGYVQYFTCTVFATQFVYLHILVSNIGAWTTVYISLIRSLSVIFPLKVKSIFTPKVTVIVITILLVIFIPIQITYSAFTTLVWNFVKEYNATLPFIIDSPTAQRVLPVNQLITNTILPVVAVFVVSINTALMANKLIEVKKWRLQNSSHSEKNAKEDSKSNSNRKSLASKDIELIKFISTTSTIFLVCLLMGLIPSIAIITFPGVGFTGINSNLFTAVFSIRFLFDSINSSINFFFYIRVSSRYRAAFTTAFKMCPK